MIAFWPGLVDESEAKGWEDGSKGAPFQPLMAEGVCPDADDAYASAYFNGLAFGGKK